ncbi:MAG: UDP-N-acetylmuramate dehydrogenase [Endomicrobiaceae bacterium]|nr:UDP-N-acetylmuramate dehydrogenase [Endomicrobiaceae bacterium]
MAKRRRTINPNIAQQLQELSLDFIENEPLSIHTTLGLGGNADFFVKIKTYQELKNLLKLIVQNNIPYFIIGGGSNLLFTDEGFKGIVFKLTGEFDEITIFGNIVTVGTAVNLGTVIKQSAEQSLHGFEHFIGIPGTVGGAVFGNAGLNNSWIGSFIDTVETMDFDGNIQKYDSRHIDFSYRCCGLKNCVLTKATFILKNGDKNDILRTVSADIEKRIFTQPLGTKNAGCVFKNPEGQNAGYLIDILGLKGFSIGGIKVSEIHGNFLVNTGNGTASEMLQLIELIKEKVREKFKIELQTEIKIIK